MGSFRPIRLENATSKTSAARKASRSPSFNRVMGGVWDVISLGFYRDLKHFADSGNVSLEKQHAAAKAAGFESADHIGAYLRTLIPRHMDTLGGILR